MSGTPTAPATADEATAGSASGTLAPFVDSAAPYTRTNLVRALDAMERATVLDYRRAAEAAPEAERIASDSGWIDLQTRARLLCADIDRRQGNLVCATRTAKWVIDWATENGDNYLASTSHEILSEVCRNIGDKAEALAHAVQSMAYLTEDHPTWVRLSRLNTLGVALVHTGSYKEAFQRYDEALAIATELADAGLCLMLLNNMASGRYLQGDIEAATGYAARMRNLQIRHQVIMNAHYLDTLARIEMAQGNFDKVEATIQPAFDDESRLVFNEADAFCACLVTLAEAQRRQGSTGRTQHTLDRAHEIATERGLTDVMVWVRHEQALLYAAAGDFELAFEEFQRFHADWVARASVEREVRARVVQALFETDEARLAGDQFREMALRDPLTGLHNRRHVDQQLPLLIERCAQSDVPLSAALLDLDHFKRINDTLSHETGDTVLKTVAELLTTSVAESAVVARLGGEEFVILLPETAAAAAQEIMERLRLAIQHHRWRPVTGDLLVTVSVGVTTVTDGGTTPSALLAAADSNLYAAKRSGRNRVIADPG